MPLTLNYRPRADDPTRDPVREFVGRLALACVGLMLIWLAWRGFHFVGAIGRAYHKANPTARPKEGGEFAAIPFILSMFLLAFGGLIVLGAVLPSRAFWRLLATDDPRSRRLSDAIPGPRFAYAVLHHTGVDPEHYDILFETSPTARLATFRSPTWPLTVRTVLERLPDHRRDYLLYEGPVSNNRGHVRRVASGTASHKLWSQTHIMLTLEPEIPPPPDPPAGAPRRKHPRPKPAEPPAAAAPHAGEIYLTRRPDNTWLVASVDGQTT